jgi:GTP-binding protein
LIDVSNTSRDPVADFKAIVKELELFDKKLLERKQLVVASKIDVLEDPGNITRLRSMCNRRKLPFLSISAVTGEGLKELVYKLDGMLK